MKQWGGNFAGFTEIKTRPCTPQDLGIPDENGVRNGDESLFFPIYKPQNNDVMSYKHLF